MSDEFFHGGNIGPLSTKTIAGFQKGLNTGPLNESWIVSGSFAKCESSRGTVDGESLERESTH